MENQIQLTNAQKLAIKEKILKDTDHNNPKIPQSSGGNFFDALKSGSEKFSNSKIKNVFPIEGEEV